MKKLETTFATKAELQLITYKLTKKIDGVDRKVDITLTEVLKFIGDIREEMMSEFRGMREELNEFRNEVRGNTRSNQSILDTHESRISHLEYMGK